MAADHHPLDDLVVVDLTIARAGPAAVRWLTDWGARVIRIESPDPNRALLGDHRSADYINLHRGKELVLLDLAEPTGRARLYELVDGADVFVENFRAPVKDRLGIDYATLAARNPRLVYGSISGYGQDGPRRDQGAVDQIIQGLGGLMSLTGEPDGVPMRTGIAVSDMAAGQQLAIGILMALRERDRTGRGQWVQTSLLEAMISFLDFQAARWTVDGQVPPREGNHHPTARPMGTYRAADGYLNVAAPSDKLWARLCAVLDDPALATDPRFERMTHRYRHRDELNAVLDAHFATADRQDWIDRLEDAGIPCGPVLAVDEMFADPQVAHLDLRRTLDHPLRGPVDVLRTPITMSESTPVTPTSAPVPLAQS